MGAYDFRLCELVGCLLLYYLNNITGPWNYGLYWVDGFIIVDNWTPKKTR